jgi:hypothetical protein
MDELNEEKELIERARAQFLLDCEQERDILAEAEIDLKFVAGQNQWNEAIERERKAEGRPALTFSKLHTYIQSVANEARQNKPQPKVNAIGGGATTDTANVLNGILRHIQYRSHADVAFDTALDYSAGGSFGYVRFTSEYAQKSFDQELRILPVQDPFSVYGVLMAACRGEDPDHALIVKRIPRDEYRRKYGKGEPMDFASSEWKEAGDWIDDKSVRVAEYWYCEQETKTLREIAMPDGTSLPIYTDDKKFKENLQFVRDPESGEPMEREEDVCVVYSCMIDGVRVLPGSKTKWVGDSIPIVAVLGRLMIVEGEVKLFSLVRHVREPQQLINIYKTAIAEKIALGNRVPYIGYKGQFKSPAWRNANKKNYPYLEVEPVKIDGTLAPLPQRQQLEEQIQALSLAVAQEIDDLKSGMGIFDASLGAKSNETTGVAQARRAQQSSITNFHFSDNLNRAEWDLCLKLLKCIPKIYDRPGRQIRIVGEDQQHSVVVINQPYQDKETGGVKHYPLDVGDYDVVVTVGPSYTTARQEGADTLQQFFQAAPQTVPILGDLWVGSLDYPWAREGARRLKAAAPQQIVNPPQDGPNGAAPIPPAVQQQMADLQKQAQDAHAFAQSLHEKLESKLPEIASKERIAQAELDFKREELASKNAAALAVIDSKDSLALLQQQIQVLMHERELSHQAKQAAAERDQAAGMQQADQQHQASQQQSAQDASAASQQSAQQHQTQQQQSAQDAAAQQQQDALPEAA